MPGQRNCSRGLLRSSERLSSAEIRMLESGLRVEVSTCAIEVVDVMMESYQKTRFDASRKYMHTMHVPISNRLYTMMALILCRCLLSKVPLPYRPTLLVFNIHKFVPTANL